MRIALIDGDSRYVASGPGGEHWQFFNFRITTDPRELSFLNLPHSAFSTPARYLMEVVRRIAERTCPKPPITPTLVFNPLFSPDAAVIGIVLARTGRLLQRASAVVFCDENNRPVAYLLPPTGDRIGHAWLSLLSTVDATLDSRLLAYFFGETTCQEAIPNLSINTGLHNGFYGGTYFRIYAWVAERALWFLRTRRLTGDVPIHFYMPHHAGDVLFFAIAARSTGLHIDGMAVNAAYLPIVRVVAPALDAMPIACPPMNRDGAALPEWEYFHALEDRLPADRCFYYARPVRDYDTGSFHLIDQFAFALGSACLRPDDLPAAQSRPLHTAPLATHDARFRTLLHFDGGWPLKVYPRHWQEELVKLLRARGHQVTVLDGQYPLPCPSERFHDLDSFRKLLGRHHLLIGMDSFPVHYAAHVAGIPTVCLFASTQPANSNALAIASYRQLERGLACRPCRAISTCPIHGTASCMNFVEPSRVLQVIEAMLANVYPRSEQREVQ